MARPRRPRRSPPPPHAAGEVRARGGNARSRVVISLDGDMYEARNQYREGIGGVVKWCEEGGITVDVSEIFGPGCKVVTTRAGGALEVELKYKERSLIFLLQGRNLYIRGWSGRGRSFELDFKDQDVNFTLDKNCMKLKIGVNYTELIHGGVENVPIGLYHLRKAFDRIWRHAGGEKIGISEDVATVAVHICEPTRYQAIFRLICRSFTDLRLSRFGKDPSYCKYVTKYKKTSGAVMQNIDRMKAGQEPLPIKINGLQHKSMAELVSDFGILHRDGYNEKDSNFEHELPPIPPIYEDTMNDIGVGGQRKHGGGGPKGGSTWARKGGLGGGSRGGRGPKGGGFAASFHSTRSSSSFHGTAGGPKDGLKVLLDLDEHVLTSIGMGVQQFKPPCSSPPSSFHGTGGLKDGIGRCTSVGVGERVLHSADVQHFKPPFSSHISYEDAHRKMQIFPTSPLPTPLFPLLVPHSLLLRQKHGKLRSFPQTLNGVPKQHPCLSLSKILKNRFISRTLRFIH